MAAAHALISFVVWLRSDRDRAGWQRAAAFFIGGTLTLQLYALSLPEFLRTRLSEFSPPSEWTNPLWVCRESLRSLQSRICRSRGGVCGGSDGGGGLVEFLRRSAACRLGHGVAGHSRRRPDAGAGAQSLAAIFLLLHGIRVC